MCRTATGGGSVVFFCKQKTAYEISTRDWSSDVCSSDLVRAHVGADVRSRPSAQAEYLPLSSAGELDLAVGLARMVARDEVLAPRLDPLHRAAHMPRRERNQEIVRIELAAHAERAASVALDHPDVRFRHAEERREDAPAQERRLGRTPDRELLCAAIPFGHRAARLDRRGGVPV